MTTVSQTIAQHPDVRTLEAELRAHVDGEIRFDPGTRGAYSTDASNFRQTPIGVVVPRTVEAAVEAVAICRRHSAPVLSRGGGTSLAGECTNTAVVIDWSKYCDRLISVDAKSRTCVVEPGIVLDELNGRLDPFGLEFGPEPATHTHCTIGGMIGNNSCGATAQRAGKVVDNIRRLQVLLYDGTIMWLGQTDDGDYESVVSAGGRAAEIYAGLRSLRDDYLREIRLRYPKIPRRVSGYNLDSLLPEHGFHLARALVGSEGTLVTVLRAELELVPVVPHRSLVMLGFPDIETAGDGVTMVGEHGPIALEGMDRRLIAYQYRKHLNPKALPLLPDGEAFLLVEFGGSTPEEAYERAAAMLRGIGRSTDDSQVAIFEDEEHRHLIWQVRESGLGATARVPDMADTWPGWEDSAVDPEVLGDYLRDLRALYRRYGYQDASTYGHFGHGCVHTRIPFELTTDEGVKAYRSFLEDAAELVASYGGSLSGEHGDGQQRGELLPVMYGSTIVAAFAQMKALFDPDNRMNPGKVIAPRRLDDDLRLGTAYAPKQPATEFAYPHDDGSFDRAALRCVGVGKCRSHSGGVMCPSYQVTREEEHSTRGRARLLFEMLDGPSRGGAVHGGWRSTEVRDALDLCLSCKGCKADCPVDVDMATYKAEFLSHHYRGRIRPLAHYSMGWLPLAAKAASPIAGWINALTHAPILDRIAKLSAGVDQHRTIPLFASETFLRWFGRRSPRGGDHGEVVLWPDTFSNHFHPHVARAATEVLESAGWGVMVPRQAACCSLTWISTGQLAVAKKVLRRTLDILRPHLRAGRPIVVLEPSCAAVFRSDLPELLPHEDGVTELRERTVTLAELLQEHTPDWRPPILDRRILVQTHCHQHAILGFEPDEAILRGTHADVRVLDSGCCGLAGNFGFEKGHFNVSNACAERVLLPALRDSDPADLVVADGFSCRTQIEQGDSAGRNAVHLAELLRAAENGAVADALPERAVAERPRAPGPTEKLLATAGASVLAAMASRQAIRGVRRMLRQSR